MEPTKRKSRNLGLEGLVKTKNLTPEGKEWLTLALDPFHDYQHQIAGYPDADASGTIVACYNLSMEVKKPAATVGNWDCHVYTLPMAAPAEFTLCTQTEGVLTSVAELGKLGLINVACADSMQDTFPGTAPFVSTNYVNTPFDTKDIVLKGVTRIVGMGMEVVNTTAEVYRQGSVTAYRMPQGRAFSEFVLDGKDDTEVTRGTANRYRAPPTNLSQAVSLLNSVTWSADLGAYQVVPFASVDNPLVNVGYQSTIVSNGTGMDPGAASVLSGQIMTPSGTFISGPGQHIPINTSGLYFSGLSVATTLRVKVKLYVERAPTPEEPDLVVLATPSAGYDIRALQLYARAINTLAVGVPVGYNAAGDWWRTVLDVISTAAPVIGMALTPTFPVAPFIAASVGATAKAIRMVAGDARQRQQRKDKKPPATVKVTSMPRRQKQTTVPSYKDSVSAVHIDVD